MASLNQSMSMPLSSVMKDVVLEVNVTGVRTALFRFRVAVAIMRFGVWIASLVGGIDGKCNVTVDTGREEIGA